MKKYALRSDILLIIAAAIWGFAFVAQRVGMEYMGPFTFNGVRFALGCISLIPLIIFFNHKKKKKKDTCEKQKNLIPGIFTGLILFVAATLQQIGMTYTTAGKAAFITGLYVVLVPILGIFLKQYIKIYSWLGALLAITGLYLLCINSDFSISTGDLFVLAGSLFWAIHILIIDYYSNKVDVLKLSCLQFITCSSISLIVAFIIETITISALMAGIVPLLFGGVVSVGVAYTLQVVAQKHAQPSHVAIILSMETVFATIGGFLILNEVLPLRSIIGCLFMLAGMLIPQIIYLNIHRKQLRIMEAEK